MALLARTSHSTWGRTRVRPASYVEKMRVFLSNACELRSSRMNLRSKAGANFENLLRYIMDKLNRIVGFALWHETWLIPCPSLPKGFLVKLLCPRSFRHANVHSHLFRRL